eukprot:874766-Rhodomonas_salina.3
MRVTAMRAFQPPFRSRSLFGAGGFEVLTCAVRALRTAGGCSGARCHGNTTRHWTLGGDAAGVRARAVARHAVGGGAGNGREH